MPLDPKGLTIDTTLAGAGKKKSLKMRIYHEPTGCMVEGFCVPPEKAEELKADLIEQLEKQVFHI